jgi:uncharacterized small protein (DUF1192 family)
MTHKTALTLCIMLFLLTGAVIASTSITLYKQHEVSLLQQRIAVLLETNERLEAQLRRQAECPREGTP